MDLPDIWHDIDKEKPAQGWVWFVPKDLTEPNLHGWAIPLMNKILLDNGEIYFNDILYWIQFEEEPQE